MKTLNSLLKSSLLVLAGVLLLAATSCSGSDRNFLERMLDFEARSTRDAPPSTVEELKQAIARYGAEADRTVAAHEKVAGYWRILAVKYTEKGLFGEAHAAALKALQFYPTNAGLYYVAGLSAAYLSRTATAEYGGGQASRAGWLLAASGAYLESIRLDERNTRSLYGLAVLYSFEMEDHAAALPLLERLLAIDTNHIDALFVYARALYGVGRLQDAVAVYDRIMAGTRIDERRRQAADNKKRILDELYGL
jgi:cytochrome c-type biogenesis protein CcmH/NrfG